MSKPRQQDPRLAGRVYAPVSPAVMRQRMERLRALTGHRPYWHLDPVEADEQLRPKVQSVQRRRTPDG